MLELNKYKEKIINNLSFDLDNNDIKRIIRAFKSEMARDNILAISYHQDNDIDTNLTKIQGANSFTVVVEDLELLSIFLKNIFRKSQGDIIMIGASIPKGDKEYYLGLIDKIIHKHGYLSINKLKKKLQKWDFVFEVGHDCEWISLFTMKN